MAERRMFAKSIVTSDAFLDLSMSARCLYFTLSMSADDDGFIGSPKAVMRVCGASQEDLVQLLQKRFLLGFESGVVVIKHWRINNYIQNDRHKDTNYLDEMKTLQIEKSGAYTEASKTDKTDDVYNLDTQYSIGKVSIDKVSIGKSSSSRGGEAADGDDNEEEELKGIREAEKDNARIRTLGGKLGRGVVKLSADQIDELLKLMEREMFDEYVDRLATFIEKKDAKIKSHYKTILKWYNEDKAVRS